LRSKQVIPYERLYPEAPAPAPTGTPADGIGLSGYYCTDNNFTNLAYAQTDPTVDFDWGGGSPSGLPSEYFSIHWSGYVQARFIDLYFVDVGNEAGVILSLYSRTHYKEVIPASQLFPANPDPTPTSTPTPSHTPSTPLTNTQTPTPTQNAPSGQVWKYYYAGAQRVAVRVTGSADPGQEHSGAGPQENGPFYTVGDHLSSTSLVVDSAGNKVSEIRYTPWGETRYTPWGETRYQGGTPPTDYGYTGQREEAGIG
jgi:hypothetical protein